MADRKSVGSERRAVIANGMAVLMHLLHLKAIKLSL